MRALSSQMIRQISELTGDFRRYADMVSWARNAKFFCFFLGAVLFSFAANADPNAVSKYIKIGFDQEIVSRYLMWLVPHFDLEFLEAKVSERPKSLRAQLLTSEILEDYVLDRNAYEALPEAMKKKLSAGLDLDKKVELLRQRTQILDASGAAVDPGRKSGLIIPESSLNLNKAHADFALQIPKAPGFESKGIIPPEGGANKNVVSDWAALNRVWSRLPLEEKQAAASISHLQTGKIASLISKLPASPKDPVSLGKFLQLRKDAPAWLRELNFTLDTGAGHVFEIALNDPATDKEHAFAVIDQLLEATKTTGVRVAPHEKPFVDNSFHLHIGLTEKAPKEVVEAFPAVLQEYKRLLAARMLAAGSHNDQIMLTELGGQKVQIAYDGNRKGLVRMIDPKHAEIREQTASPRATYEEFTGLLELGPLKTREKVAAEIKTIFAAHADVPARIANLNLKALLDFRDVLGADALTELFQKRKINEKFVEALGKLFAIDPTIPNFQLLLEDKRRNPDASQLLDSADLYHQFAQNPETRAFILEYYRKSPAEIPPLKLSPLKKWQSWVQESQRIDLLAAAKAEPARIRLLEELSTSSFIFAPDERLPDRVAERNRLIAVLRKMYEGGSGREESWLLANALFKKMTLQNLANPNLSELLRRSAWHRNNSIRRAALETLEANGTLRGLPLWFKGNLQEGRSGKDLLNEFARENEKGRKAFIRAILALGALGASPPAEFMRALKAARKAPPDPLAGLVEKLESIKIQSGESCGLRFKNMVVDLFRR